MADTLTASQRLQTASSPRLFHPPSPRSAARSPGRSKAPSTTTRSSDQVASRSLRSGTAASCPPPGISATAASSLSPARTSMASGSRGCSSTSAIRPSRVQRLAGGMRAMLELKRRLIAGSPVGVCARRPARAGTGRATGCGVARRGDRASDPAVPCRGECVVGGLELGSHAGAQAVQHRRDCAGHPLTLDRAIQRPTTRRSTVCCGRVRPALQRCSRANNNAQSRTSRVPDSRAARVQLFAVLSWASQTK